MMKITWQSILFTKHLIKYRLEINLFVFMRKLGKPLFMTNLPLIAEPAMAKYWVQVLPRHALRRWFSLIANRCISKCIHGCKERNNKARDTPEQQPTAWLVPYACTQHYHPGSESHGELFRLCQPRQASSAWHSCWAENRTKSPMYSALYCYISHRSMARSFHLRNLPYFEVRGVSF